MLSDLRFALRQLLKSPGFAVTAIATLALGIGACTAMFSIVHAVLLKPLPVREPEQLVWIENVYGGGLSGRTSRTDVFNGWREQNQSFEELGAYFAFSDYSPLTMNSGDRPERLRGVGVTETFLPVLGVRMLHGRNFSAEECAWSGPGAAILSHSFWQSRFEGDPAIVGRTVSFNDGPSTIVGILPPSFDFDSVFTPGSEVEVLTPFPLTPETARWGNTVFGIGRLKPGVTPERAQAELNVISDRLRETTVPNAGDFGAIVSPLNDSVRGRFRGAFALLTGAVACVLAIACVNLSNLLLARINVRRQEFAVRVALGARRRHLVRQAVTESLLLAFAGAVVGVPLAVWITYGLTQLQTFGVPLLQNARVDPTVLLVTIGLTTLAGLVCGLIPAVHLSLSHRHAPMQQATHQRTAGRSMTFARNTLVVSEVALACMLLVGAGLLIRSFTAVLKVDLGFQPENAVAWRLDGVGGFDTLAEANTYYESLVDRVSALPGVTAVGLSDTLPLGRNRTWGTGGRGMEYPPGEFPAAYPRVVDDNYLQTMRISLIAGRFFDERDRDSAQDTIIINENLARAAWPDRDALGQILEVNDGSRVIGIVENVRHSSLENAGGNEMYLNYHQTGDWSVMELVVRSSRRAESLVPEVRRTLESYDPRITAGAYYQLVQLIDHAVAPRRLITSILSSFSSLALFLAALGLYGVIAYSVTQRTQEIGIRMAIGAQRPDVLFLILRGGLALVLLGVLLGLAGAYPLTFLLRTHLFGVGAHDPLVFVSIAAVLIVVAAIACLLPAIRATKVDPVIALRAE